MSDISAIPAITARLLSDSAGVNALVDSRIYADQAPEVGQEYPQIVLSETGTEIESEYSTGAGLVQSTIEVNCMAHDKATASHIAAAVVQRIADQGGTWGMTVVQGAFLEDQSSDSVSIPELGPDAQLYAQALKFMVWFEF